MESERGLKSPFLVSNSQDKITANKTIFVKVVLDTKTMTDFTSLHFEWENGCTDGTTVHGLHFSIPNIS